MTEQTNIVISARKGVYRPPVSVHLPQQYFAERRSVATQNQFDISFEASANPNFVVRGSKGKGDFVDHDLITLSMQPVFIAWAPRNDFQWQYKPMGPYGTNVELSSDNPQAYHQFLSY